MSKASVKKKVAQMEQQKLVELVMDLYSIKEAKRYLESLFEPHFDKDLAEAKKKIESEFAPTRRSKKRFTAAKKVISDFRQINPPAEMVAELMLYVPYMASRVAGEWYVCSYNFNVSISNNVGAALKFIHDKQLEEQFSETVFAILNHMTQVPYDGYLLVLNAIRENCPEILE